MSQSVPIVVQEDPIRVIVIFWLLAKVSSRDFHVMLKDADAERDQNKAKAKLRQRQSWPLICQLRKPRIIFCAQYTTSISFVCTQVDSKWSIAVLVTFGACLLTGACALHPYELYCELCHAGFAAEHLASAPSLMGLIPLRSYLESYVGLSTSIDRRRQPKLAGRRQGPHRKQQRIRKEENLIAGSSKTRSTTDCLEARSHCHATNSGGEDLKR